MSDLVQELRARADKITHDPSLTADLLREAADEISRLQAGLNDWATTFERWAVGNFRLAPEADVLKAERDALQARIAKLEAVAEAAKILAYPRGFYDTNMPHDLLRALEALEKDE